MPTIDDKKPARYARKNPHDHAPAIEPEKREPPVVFGNPAGTSAALKALGDVEAPKGRDPRGAGGKAAAHGLGFMARVKNKLRMGTLVALAGLTLVGGSAPMGSHVMTANMPSSAVAMRVAQVEHRTRAYESSRALSDAESMLATWNDSMARDPAFVVDAARAKELVLAGLLPAVPGPSDDFAAFAQKNLGNDTRQLIRGVLATGHFKLGDDGRAVLAAAVNTGVVSSDGKVTVVGDQNDGKIRLKGQAGASVEVINLSTIPTKRLHTDDTFVLGKVGADGTFAGVMDMKAGDVIRLRLKLPDGSASEWVDFKTSGVDARNAEVALFRIGLVDNFAGKIAVNNINDSRPVSEPGAVMRFVNLRTNESTDVTFDKNGTFAPGTTIPGKAGDTFSMRITDGVNDKELKQEIGKVVVRQTGTSVIDEFNIPDPTLHHDEMDSAGKPKFALERFRGPLFESAAQYTDVTQGQLGDCYFPASISSIAFHRPGWFEKIVQQKEERDLTTGQITKVWYEVTFKVKDWDTGKFTDHVQKVDGDLYVGSWGGPLYGSDDGVRTPEDMELWFSIVEKAYADWKGASYEAIGNGGSMDQVFRDVLGVDASSMSIFNRDVVWKQIMSNVNAHRPIGAGTHGDDQAAIYANTGVYADHAYSVLGYKTDNGVQYVQVRNPWGESEPFPGDGKNDGIFWLKLDDFMKLYQTLYYAIGD